MDTINPNGNLDNSEHKTIDTLELYDEMDETAGELNALIQALLLTDFVEEAEPDTIKDYIRCMEKQAKLFQDQVNQIGRYFNYL